MISWHKSQWNWPIESGSRFCVLDGLLLATTKCTLRQLLFVCSCICCGTVFQAAVWPQECLFPFLIQASSYPPRQKPVTVNIFYYKTCKVGTTEVLLTLSIFYISFFFLHLLFLCWSKSKQVGTELQAWPRATVTGFKCCGKAAKNYLLLY